MRPCGKSFGPEPLVQVQRIHQQDGVADAFRISALQTNEYGQCADACAKDHIAGFLAGGEVT